MKRFFLISFFSLFTFTFTAFAEDYLFPLPADSWSVTHGYEHDGAFWSHQGAKAKYSIDFMLAAFDKENTFNFTNETCYGLGSPILATRPGKIIDIRKPSSERLNDSYGYMVRVGYEDGSYTWYAHMLENTFAVEMGEEVEAGQVLGLLGSTGYTKGGECYWENNFGFQFNNIAPHLHFETNTTGGLGILQEPLIGSEAYADITKAKSPYISNTQMIDPKGFWNQWNGKVPYQLTYDYSSDYIPTYQGFIPSGGNGQIAEVRSISPLYAQRNKTVTFTIQGQGMPQNMIVEMEGCEPEFKKQKHYEQTFSCFVQSDSPSPFLYGEIWSSEERKKEAEENSKIKPNLRFAIELTDENHTPPKNSAIAGVGFGGETWPSYDRSIFVIGYKLPPDLRLDMPACEKVSYTYRSAGRQEMVCTLPSYTNRHGPTTLNGFLISDSANIKEPITLKEDYSRGLFTVSPPSGSYGKRQTFLFQGPNLGRTRAAHVANCGQIEIEPIDASSVKISCNPQVEAILFSPQLKKDYRSGVHHFLLKAQVGADEVIAEGYLRFDMQSQTWINSVSPQHPVLEQENTFIIEGESLPAEVSTNIQNCTSKTASNVQVSKNASSIHYPCQLATNGGATEYERLSTLLTSGGNQNSIAKALKNQERQVEIKLSPKFSAGDPVVLYRGMVQPITQYYGVLTLSKNRSTKENEALIQEILKSDGEYKEDFVKQFGWIKANSNHYKNVQSKGFSSGQINPLKQMDNYILDCSLGSYVMPLIEKRLAYRVLKEDINIIPWLFTLGECAERINKTLLDEGMSVYPKKAN